MITKKSFIAMIDAIREQMVQDEKNGELISKLCDPAEQFYNTIFTTPITDKLIKILANEMQCQTSDQIDNDIAYWVYEAKFGEHFDKMWREDGSEVPLKTASDLYDWLLENIKE